MQYRGGAFRRYFRTSDSPVPGHKARVGGISASCGVRRLAAAVCRTGLPGVLPALAEASNRARQAAPAYGGSKLPHSKWVVRVMTTGFVATPRGGFVGAWHNMPGKRPWRCLAILQCGLRECMVCTPASRRRFSRLPVGTKPPARRPSATLRTRRRCGLAVTPSSWLRTGMPHRARHAVPLRGENMTWRYSTACPLLRVGRYLSHTERMP